MARKLANEAKLGLKSHYQALASCATPLTASAAVVRGQKCGLQKLAVYKNPHGLVRKLVRVPCWRSGAQKAALGAQQCVAVWEAEATTGAQQEAEQGGGEDFFKTLQARRAPASCATPAARLLQSNYNPPHPPRAHATASAAAR